MKVVHIIRGEFSPNSLNGVYKVIDSLSNSLSKIGNDVTVCSVGKPNVDIFSPVSYSHVHVKESFFRFFLTKEFEAFLLQQPIDTIFHFHSVFIPWFLNAIKFLKRNNYNHIVLTPHGQYVDIAIRHSLKKKIFFHFFDSKVIRNVSIVHIIGKTELNSYILDNANQYAIIPNGCNVMKRDFVPKDKLIFGYLGRLSIKQKGLDLLLNAFAQYKKEGGSGYLKLAGAGEDEARLHNLATELGMKTFVVFEGIIYDEKKWEFLESCSFFCHPSRWDGLPTAAMEAATAYVPLLVSMATNMDSYILNYRAGFILPLCINEMASVLHKAENLFTNKGKYVLMCRNAHSIIEKELNWDNIAIKIQNELYIKSIK